MPKVDDIAFAKLVSGDKVHRTTCLVYRGKVDGRWWRKSGMVYSPEDFADVIASGPEVVVLGVGIMNKVTVPSETVNLFKEKNISCEIMDSNAAMLRFNELYASGKAVVGAFHLM
jgi:uncharacterized protein